MRLKPIPDFILVTPADIVFQTGQDPYGNPVELTVTGNCRLEEKSTRIMDAEKRLIQLAGRMYFAGDIAPSLPVLEGGIATIGERTWQIYSAERPRNPDGTVHHTMLNLR